MTRESALANVCAIAPRAGRSARLSGGLTEKMLRFAEAVAEGMSLADAYRTSFHTANMRDKTIRDEASRLAKNPGVAAAIEAIRSEKEARNRMLWHSEEEAIWNTLWRLIDDPDVVTRSKLKALTLAARMAGLLTKS